MKAKALILNSDFTGEIKKIKIVDGKVIIDKYEFIVDKIRPLIIKKPLGKKELLYLFKWDCIVASYFQENKQKVEKTPEELENENYVVEYKKPRLRGLLYRKIFKRPKDVMKEKPKEMVLKKLVPLEPEFYKGKVLPELLRETADTRFLKSMKKYSVKAPFEFKPEYLKLLLAIGISVFIILFLMGYIRF